MLELQNENFVENVICFEGSKTNQCLSNQLEGKYALITTGIYTDRLAQISEKRANSNRFHLILMNDKVEYIKKSDSTTIYASLLRSGFELLDVVDTPSVPEVLHALKLKRKAIKLQTNDTSLKSKLKKNIPETTLDEQESRNNLYWAQDFYDNDLKQIDSQSQGSACIWYGGSVALVSDIVHIVPINIGITSGHEYLKPDNFILCSSTIQECSNQHVTAATTDNLLNQPSMQKDKLTTLRVVRNKLTPLDEDLVYAQYADENDINRNFLLALLQFSEWDDPQRDSYMWPEFIVELTWDANKQHKFIEQATTHPLLRSGRALSDVFLFLFCAQQLGIMDQFDYSAYLQQQPQCTEDILNLLINITAFQQSSSDEEEHSFQDGTFRSSSRVGCMFQAMSADTMGGLNADVSNAIAPQITSNVLSSSTGAPPAFRSLSNGSVDLIMEEFLGLVQLKRVQHLLVNQLIEAPLDSTAFKSELLKCMADKGWKSIDNVADSICSTCNDTTNLSGDCNTDADTTSTATTTTTFASTNNDNVTPSCDAAVDVFGTTTTNAAIIKNNNANTCITSSDATTSVIIPSTGLQCYRNTQLLNQFIADSRRRGHSPTTFCTIKFVLRGTTTTTTVNNNNNTTNKTKLMIATNNSPKDAAATTRNLITNSYSGSSNCNLDVDSVIVNSGSKEFKAPVELCRILSMPDDIAMEIFYNCDRNVSQALTIIDQLLSVVVPPPPPPLSVRDSVQSSPQTPTIASSAIFDWGSSNNKKKANKKIISLPSSSSSSSSSSVKSSLNKNNSNNKTGKQKPYSYISNLSAADMNRCIVSQAELELFHSVVSSYYTDVRKVFRKYNKKASKQREKEHRKFLNMAKTNKENGPYFFINSNNSFDAETNSIVVAEDKMQYNGISNTDVNGSNSCGTTDDYISIVPSTVLVASSSSSSSSEDISSVVCKVVNIEKNDSSGKETVTTVVNVDDTMDVVSKSNTQRSTSTSPPNGDTTSNVIDTVFGITEEVKSQQQEDSSNMIVVLPSSDDSNYIDKNNNIGDDKNNIDNNESNISDGKTSSSSSENRDHNNSGELPDLKIATNISSASLTPTNTKILAAAENNRSTQQQLTSTIPALLLSEATSSSSSSSSIYSTSSSSLELVNPEVITSSFSFSSSSSSSASTGLSTSIASNTPSSPFTSVYTPAERICGNKSVKEINWLFFLLYPDVDQYKIPLRTVSNTSGLTTNQRNNNQRLVASGVAADFTDKNGVVAGGNYSSHANRKTATYTVNGGGDGVAIRTSATTMPRSYHPNRWPSNLPLMRHSLYWVRVSNSPCVCTGVQRFAANGSECMLNIIILSSESYYHESPYAASKLEPLDDELLRLSVDERAIGFASALMDFVEWEMKSLPPNSLLRRFYTYPDFVMKMLRHMPSWAAWRKQAERSCRGQKISRHIMYLNALIADYELLMTLEDKQARYSISNYPWDDTPELRDDDDDDDDEDDSNTGKYRGNNNSNSRNSNNNIIGKVSASSNRKKKIVVDSDENDNNVERDSGCSDSDFESINGEESINSEVNRSNDAHRQQQHSVGQNRQAKRRRAACNNKYIISGQDDYADERESKESLSYFDFEKKKAKKQKLLLGDNNSSSNDSGSINVKQLKKSKGLHDTETSKPNYFPRDAFSTLLNSNNNKDSSSSSGSNLNKKNQVSVAVQPPPPPPPVRSWLNLFWIPRSQIPAIYFDEPKFRYTNSFTIIPICCFTYHYPFQLSPLTKHQVEPLSLEKLKQCTDERTHDFALALVEFAQWERKRQANLQADNASISSSGTIRSLHKDTTTAAAMTTDGTQQNYYNTNELQPEELFTWPSFILKLLSVPKDWFSWRKLAERSGRSSPRRTVYFKALCADHLANLSLEEETIASEIAKRAAVKEASEILLSSSLPPPSPPSQVVVHSFYNLFWLPRNNLPCMYYDDPENRFREKFVVMPICTNSYHYPLTVTASAVIIEPLSLRLLKRCTDERIHDFTLALLDFARWELAEKSSQTNDLYFNEDDTFYEQFEGTSSSSSSSGSNSSCNALANSNNVIASSSSSSSSTLIAPPALGKHELYDWPVFIKDLINTSDKWAAWRKKAERRGGDNRRNLYFKLLREDYEDILKELLTE